LFGFDLFVISNKKILKQAKKLLRYIDIGEANRYIERAIKTEKRGGAEHRRPERELS
jgi:hypothetical protein